MHLSPRQKKVGLLLLALVVLFLAAWQLACLDREPRHKGKTVTEWLDSLVLYTNETRSNGDGFTVFRSSDEIVADPAFQALQAIGSRAVPVLMERIAEPAGYSPEMRRSERWGVRLQWAWYRLRGPAKVARPLGAHWPPSQTARKTAAALMLLSLGTNGHGGFSRLMETYAAAPQFTSVYGARPGELAGAPVGFAPSWALRLACATCPQIRDELVAGVMEALQHTNAACRSMALDCTGAVPELRHIFFAPRQ